MSHRRVFDSPRDRSETPSASRSTAIASDSFRAQTNGLYTTSPDGSDGNEEPFESDHAAAGSDALEQSVGDHQSMLWWGYTLLGGSALSLLVGLWSLLVGPLCSPTGLRLLDVLVEDTYYKYLVVLLVPVTVCFVIINWWGLKIFRHA